MNGRAHVVAVARALAKTIPVAVGFIRPRERRPACRIAVVVDTVADLGRARVDRRVRVVAVVARVRPVTVGVFAARYACEVDLPVSVPIEEGSPRSSEPGRSGWSWMRGRPSERCRESWI